jgi:acyl-ACP thioesterase
VCSLASGDVNVGPVPVPASGRIFSVERRVRLGDVDATARLRLDAVARYLQDVANDDAVDGRYSDAHGWVVRRTEIWAWGAPRYMEDVTLRTWCGGYGSHWAERRTSIVSAGGRRIEAAALWVHVDLKTMKLKPLPEDFVPLVEESSGGRRIRATLRVGKGLPTADWDALPTMQVRATDIDAVGHMNNAVYWEAVEQEFTDRGGPVLPLHATVEHHAAIAPDQEVRIARLVEHDRTVLRHLVDGGTMASAIEIAPWSAPPPSD